MLCCSTPLPCAERQNHARELIKEYDLSTVDGIVIASGDGLLYEVYVYLFHLLEWCCWFIRPTAQGQPA